MAGIGFEPMTSRLWALRATKLLYPAISIDYYSILFKLKIFFFFFFKEERTVLREAACLRVLSAEERGGTEGLAGDEVLDGSVDEVPAPPHPAGTSSA